MRKPKNLEFSKFFIIITVPTNQDYFFDYFRASLKEIQLFHSGTWYLLSQTFDLKVETQFQWQ